MKFFRFSLLCLFFIYLITTICAQETHVHEDGTVHTTETTTTGSSNSTSTAVEAEHDHDHDHDHGLEASATAEEEGHDHGHSHSHGISCDMEIVDDHNTSLRIGSVFIIMATSAVGIFAPIVLYRFGSIEQGSARDWLLTAGKFFGTGVIISTAFIHMLPEALERFGSECIGEGWHSYHAFGGLFCMIAAFLLQVIELAALSNLDAIARRNANNSQSIADSIEIAPTKGSEKVLQPEANHHEHNHHGINGDGHVHSAGFLEYDQSARSIGTLILELGIAIHSIIIGITLGTADSSAFQTLLIALVFHQFFEGIALGTRVNELQHKSWKKPVLMAIIFVCMTPIGVAIGIGIRSSLNPPAVILAQAILDSLSAGILLYSAFVSLMSIEINHNTGFRQSSLQRKVFCFLCMYVGAALMSVLGIWA